MSIVKRRVGGSSVAPILGRSQWKTPLDIYNELRGEERVELPATEDQDRGNFLEPGMIAWASKKIGIEFFKPTAPAVAQHPTDEWATYSADGIPAHRGAEILEVKCPRTGDGWGDEMTAEVPEAYLLQGAWGLYVLDAKICYFAALIHGTVKIFKYERDLELEGQIVERVHHFIEHHVKAENPPPATYGDDANVLKMFPRNTQPHMSAFGLSDQGKVIVDSYLRAYDLCSKSDDALKMWEPPLKELIGENSGIEFGAKVDEFGCKRIDWKKNKSAAPRYKQAFDELSKIDPRAAEEILKKHTPEDGPRVLRPYMKEGK